MAIIKNEETLAQPKSPQAEQFVAPQIQPQVNVNNGADIKLNDIRSLNFSRQDTSGTAGLLVQRVQDRINSLQAAVKDITKVYLYQAPQPTHYPQVVITRDFKSKGKHFVIAYSFLVEAGAPKPPPRPISHNGQQYNLVTAPSDTVTSGMINNLITYIQSFRGADTLVAIAGFATLPSELDIREDARDDILRLSNHMCYTAECAIVNEAAKYAVIDEVKADANYILKSGFPVIGKDTSPPPLTDIAGLPIRSDFNIRLGQKSQENSSVWDPNVAPRPDITMLHGYVDLVRRDLHEPIVTQVHGYNQVLDPKYNKFVPKAVITKVDVLLEKAVTSEMILLALSTATFLRYRGNWLDAFHPRVSRDDINLRDVTAIGYDSPLMETNARLNVQGMSDLADLNSLLLTAISPDLLISIDYEEATDQSWKLADFYYAAGGTKNADSTAKTNIIRAADNLTFGKFSQLWNNSTADILYDENNRIALGYWIDRHNEKRDIRELDYLAMLNFLGDRDHVRVQDWDDTFNAATGVPLDVRLERRERIARELISSYTLKGWARRLTFNASFLETLNRALVECRVIPTLETAITDLTGRTLRGNPSILAMAMQNDPGAYGAYSAGRGQGGLGGIGTYGVAPTSNFRGFGN